MKHEVNIAFGSAVAGVWLLLALGAGDLRAQSGWRSLEGAEMPTPRAETATAVLDGYVYVVGGRDVRGRAVATVERFDPVTTTWEARLPELRRARYNAAAVVLGGALYVIGGRAVNEREVLDDVERFDPTEGRWRTVASLREGREGHAAVVFDGRIFVFGGSEEGRILQSVEVYDPAGDAWEELETWRLDLGRWTLSVVALGDSLYAFGGVNDLFGVLRPALVFGAEGVRRTLTPPTNFVARGNFAAVVHEDAIFIIGGRGPDRADRPNILDDVTVYVPDRDQWLRAPALQTARESFGAASAGGRIFVLGGRNAFEEVIGTVEVFGTEAPTGNEAPAAAPAFGLAPPYPNPFRAGTTVPFTVPFDVSGEATGLVVVEVFDLFGRRVATLVDAVLPPGRHMARWDGRTADGRAAASGVYLVRLRQGPREAVRAVSIIR